MRPALVIIAYLAILSGCAAVPEPVSDPAVGTLVEYEVFGMDCPGCHGGLEKLALNIPGVHTAKASWEDKKLTLVIVDGAEVTDEQVRSAIERANFTPGERLR